MNYIRRITDEVIDRKKEAFNAFNIVGPKGCGKTRTAKERCKTVIEFQDEERREGYIAIAENSPSLLLKNEKPILFDEWQDAPKIWGTVRKYCDDNPEETGNIFLTGSSSKKTKTPHTGTGRISEIEMFPMTMSEKGISNGKISISSLIGDEKYEIDGKISDLKIEELIYEICCGGWPRCLAIQNKEAKLEVAADYFRQICNKDISAIDSIKRDPELTRLILWSYARNIATLAKTNVIISDVQANISASKTTIYEYIDSLRRLYVLKDIDAWTPQIRSKTAIRSSKKHIFIDPSIAIAALGIGPEYFYRDFDLFGHVFENTVIRDLLSYAQINDARVYHYHDETDLEIDAVYQLKDGRYALIEIKTSDAGVKSAENNLLKLSSLIHEHNLKISANKDHPGVKYREPDVLIVICANANMAYTTHKGVKVIPFGCIKE